MTNTRTYDVPFHGYAEYTARVEASDPSEALKKAIKLRDEINLKSTFFVKDWQHDDELIEEIDVVAEATEQKRSRYYALRYLELGDDVPSWDEVMREFDARGLDALALTDIK